MTDLLDWAEKAGLENIRFRIQIAESLSKDADTTLNLLLAAVAATVAYTVKAFDTNTVGPLAIGAASMSAWLMVVCFLLIWKCIKTTLIMPPTNEPVNLFQKEHALDVLREVELKNIQGRINQIAYRNSIFAMWLDRVRLLALASPIIFVVAAGCSDRWGFAALAAAAG